MGRGMLIFVVPFLLKFNIFINFNHCNNSFRSFLMVCDCIILCLFNLNVRTVTYNEFYSLIGYGIAYMVNNGSSNNL
jgi:hypothetical protein